MPRYPVIAGTALLAIGVTIAWWAKIDVSALFESSMIRRGEFWRLVTSIFPHGGILHLGFNIYWLWVFGTLVEDVYGHLKTAALVLLFAVGSSAFEFALLEGGIGLSGVGYGLFGLLWVLASRDERFRDAIDRRTIELFIAWFFFCIVTTATGLMAVANIAHGVGAVLGILTGFAIVRRDQRPPLALSIGAVLVFGLWAATLGRPRVNLSKNGGFEEAQWGFEALLAQRNQDAIRWFRDATRYQPNSSEFWYNLGVAYSNLANKTAAIAAFRTAAEHGNANAAYYLGTLYDSGSEGVAKDDAQAVRWYRVAAAQDNAEALNNVAWTYATSQDPAIRNPAAALEYARKAVSLEKDQPDPNYLDTLAEAYYVNGRYDDAVKTEQQAIASLAKGDKSEFQKKLQKELQKSLEKYEAALRSRKGKTDGK